MSKGNFSFAAYDHNINSHNNNIEIEPFYFEVRRYEILQICRSFLD